jgi:hypothetical protein
MVGEICKLRTSGGTVNSTSTEILTHTSSERYHGHHDHSMERNLSQTQTHILEHERDGLILVNTTLQRDMSNTFRSNETFKSRLERRTLLGETMDELGEIHDHNFTLTKENSGGRDMEE